MTVATTVLNIAVAVVVASAMARVVAAVGVSDSNRVSYERARNKCMMMKYLL
jgi:hypothetical protein